MAAHELSADAIDADPLALLPGGAVAMLRVDVDKLAQSNLGPPLVQLSTKLVGEVGITGLVPERDLSKIVVGIYSMQGSDLVGIGVGRFDSTAFERAATSPPPGRALGVVKSTYAGRTLYTVMNVGACILTPKTVLFGNETGMRRALDRLHEGRVGRRLPPWMDELLTNEKASFAVGADLRVEAFSDSVRQQLPFVQNLESGRILGNFESPGVNLAGSLGYASTEAAAQAAQSIQSLSGLVSGSSWLMKMLGVTQPVVRLSAKAHDTDVDFVTALDGAAVSKMLQQSLGMMPGGADPAAPAVPAKLSEGVR